MAKKKSKSKRNDARGYATTSSKVKQPTQKVSINTKTHTGITNLLSDLSKHSTSSSNYINKSTDGTSQDFNSHRFLQKVTKIHENLAKYGFSEDQIKSVIQKLSVEKDAVPLTFEIALDWLCVNLSEEDLPSLFTENSDAIRDKILGKSSSISVIKADPKLAKEFRTQLTKNHDEEKRIKKKELEKIAKRKKEEKEKKAAEAEKAKEAQKAWLLEQYAYEEEEIDEEMNPDPDPVQSITKKTQELKVAASELSPEEIRLSKLEEELQQLNNDLNDEASNYMRSKHEINSLKKQKKNLETTVRKLKGKVEKIKRDRDLKANEEQHTEVKEEETSEVEKHAISEDIECDGDDENGYGDMFAMFDEDTNNEDISSSLTNDTELPEKEYLEFKIPATSIPQNWTGKTPLQILEDHCRKNRYPKPKFHKLPNTSHGCRIQLSGLKNQYPLTIEEKGPFDNFTNSKHYLATQALYELNPALPLYRLFPPIFRDLWKSWLDIVEQTKLEKLTNAKELKEKKMKGLIDSISMVETTKNISKSSAQDFEKHLIQLPENASDSWDHSDGEEEEKLDRKDNNINLLKLKNKRLSTSNGQKMRKDFESLCKTKVYQQMLSQRKTLPMYAFRESLLSTMEKNPVTVLCGETGCGKTTQCPQYLLEQAIQGGNGDKVNIICTQPRRVAAMSVAERVAEEFGMSDGRTGAYVGYHIRMEAKKSDKTRLLFCTTGVILRRLQDDPELTGVTHIVVDEVHERQWQIDFLLIALRKLIQTTRRDLKIILMSATLDSKLFCNFFKDAPFLSVPGRTFPVSNFHLEDLMDATDHMIEEYSPYAKKIEDNSSGYASMFISGRGGTRRKENFSYESQYHPSDVSENYMGYKMSTRRSMDRVNEEIINYDLIEDVLNLILLNRDKNTILVAPEVEKGIPLKQGATLIFLPGLGEIRTLSERLRASRTFGKNDKFDIIMLHSTLSPKDQRKAFQPSKKGCLKIILSTNIAETSVTIPDVTCVIDTGLVREVRQNERTSTSTLVTDWCSKASAKQRAGRAGRVRPGLCCKLFSSWTAERIMRDQAMPELQRVPLEEVCLSILAGGLGSNCMEFLSHAPQPPSEESVSKALLLLEEVGAIESSNNTVHKGTTRIDRLTPLGHHLAKLPLHVKLGKMLIFGCLFKCLDKVLTIAATLSSKSPFSNFVSDDASHASAAHRTFIHPSSDFLSLCNVWDAYRKAKAEGHSQSRRFCSKMYLNHAALMEINDARRQFLDLLCQIGFVKRSDNSFDRSETLHKSMFNKNGENLNLVNAVICAGFYPNIVQAVKESSGIPTLWFKKERVHFHSSSINHNKRDLGSEWILFHEKFATSRVFISATSITKPFSLLLFGGKIDVKHLERKVLVDDRIQLSAAAKTGVMFRQLRQELISILEVRMSNATETGGERSERIIDGIVELLTNE